MSRWDSGFNTAATLILAGAAILWRDHKLYGATQQQHGKAVAVLLVVAFAAQALMWVVRPSRERRQRRQARRQQPARQPVRDLWQ